jgi:hypothetical protein
MVFKLNELEISSLPAPCNVIGAEGLSTFFFSPADFEGNVGKSSGSFGKGLSLNHNHYISIVKRKRKEKTYVK